jgi:hypothetical protein
LHNQNAPFGADVSEGVDTDCAFSLCNGIKWRKLSNAGLAIVAGVNVNLYVTALICAKNINANNIKINNKNINNG